MKIKKCIYLFLRLFFCVSAFSQILISQDFSKAKVYAVPAKTINYQGQLKDSSSVPITTSTSIIFSIYNHPSSGLPTDTPSSGGPLLWKQTHDGVTCSQITPNSSGIISVSLGSCVAFPSYMDFSENYYLGLTIGTNSEATPRLRLSSVPFAENVRNITFDNNVTNAFRLGTSIADYLSFNSSTGNETITLSQNTVIGTPTQQLTIGAILQGATPLVFEGSTVDINRTTIAITDPTGNRIITLPDNSGTVAVAVNPLGPLTLNAAGILDCPSCITGSNISSTAFVQNGNTFGTLATLGTIDTFDLRFITNNTEAMRILSGGNVGIGTSTPTEMLHLAGNFRLDSAFMPGNNAGTAGQFLVSQGPGLAPIWQTVSLSDGSLNDAYNFGGPAAGRIINILSTIGNQVELRTPYDPLNFLGINTGLALVGDGTGYNKTTSGIGFTKIDLGYDASAFVFSDNVNNFSSIPFGYLLYANNPGNEFFALGITPSLSSPEYAGINMSSWGLNLYSGSIGSGNMFITADNTVNISSLGNFLNIVGSNTTSNDRGVVMITNISPSYPYQMVRMDNTWGSMLMTQGSGNPNGFVNASSGSLYFNLTPSSSSDVLWVKTGGMSSVGWSPVSAGTLTSRINDLDNDTYVETDLTADGLTNSVNIVANGFLLGEFRNTNSTITGMTDGFLGNGAPVVLNGGISTAAQGGDVQILSGAGATGSGNVFIETNYASPTGSSGSIVIRSGYATGGALVGNINIQSGDSFLSTSNGGSISIQAGGSYSGSGNGGVVSIQSGSSSSMIGGDVNISAGTGGLLGGGVNISAGDSSTNAGGNLYLSSGNGQANAGSITLQAGAASLGPGGDIFLNTGNSTGLGNSGSFVVNAGYASSGIGGAITLNAGWGTLGTGEINLFSGSQYGIGVVNIGGLSGAGATQATNLRFLEADIHNGDYVGFKAPDNLAASSLYVLPPSDGTAGQVLTTDGSGNLSWTSSAGGADLQTVTTVGNTTTHNMYISKTTGIGEFGITSPDNNVVLNMTGNTGNALILMSGDNSLTTAGITVTGGSTMNIFTASGNHLWLEASNGYTGIGTSSVTNMLTVADLTTTNVARFNGLGGTQCTVVTGTGWSCTSDERLKKDIIEISNASEIISGLRPVSYNWQPGGAEQQYGFIAQEVESILPGLVTTNSDGFKSLQITGLIPFIVKSQKEQINELNNLKTKIDQIQLTSNTLAISSLLDEINLQIVGLKSSVENLENKVNAISQKIENFENNSESFSISILENTTSTINLANVSIQSAEINLANFVGEANFNGFVTLKSTLRVNGNIAGKATLTAGYTKVDISFPTLYTGTPIVTATPVGGNSLTQNFRYTITNVSAYGFSIEINEPLGENLEFNWIALDKI